MDLILATNNAGKRKEIISLLKDLDVKVDVHLMEDCPDCHLPEEDGKTFEENASKKALAVAFATQKLALADDSGLIVDALGGEPGIYSARYAGSEQDPKKNIVKLLDRMKNFTGSERKAKFVCSMAIAKANKLIHVVTGICEGEIGYHSKGEHGFGYDPVFYFPPANKTFAELTPKEKNSVSHRASALRQVHGVLKNLLC